ncbi:MAG TPA: sigma-70 family RNA polymerase sigma factor [Thermoleophilaceae bacterium]
MLTKLLKAVAVPRPRPSRTDIEPAALELVRRHGAQIMSTARRYAASPEDAEDAYQRGLEILLTKAPTTSADDLVPWLKTVVKHEAFALRKQRERQGVPTGDEPSGAGAVDTHEQVERLERLQRGAEAMQRLKPQEIRCMLLLAEGHSYRQIQEITGFSYTKVNRCLTEGRRSFLRRVEGIEAGAECERLAPHLSALADGVANARDMAALRPHLRTCLSCRAALRDAREVPARVASLAPIALLAGGHGTGLRPIASWIHERLTALVLRGQDLLEVASSHKLAAAAASAAALGGGGIATVEVSRHASAPAHHRHHVHRAAAPAARPERRWRPPVAVPLRPVPEHRTRKPAHHRIAPPPSPKAAPTRAEPMPASPPPPAPTAAPAEPQTGEFGP